MKNFINASGSRLVIAAVVAAAGCTAAAEAQCTITKLVPSDIATNDFFGGTLSVSHEPGGVPVCAMGMSADDSINGLNAGSVRFATRSGQNWSITNSLTLTAYDGLTGDAFGSTVAYTFPALAVGAEGKGANGAVYMYKRAGGGWNLDNRIDAPSVPGGDVNAGFGRAIAISGDWVLIGAPYRSPHIGNAANQWAGAAYFYQRQQNGLWTLQQSEMDADNTNAENHALFGASVAMSGDVAVVGVPGSKGPVYAGPEELGEIHIYRKSIFDAWLNDTPLIGYAAAGVQANDKFGASVSIDGNTIAVGAPGDDLDPAENPGFTAKASSGCVYMLRYVPNGNGGGTWTPDGKIIAPDPIDNGQFGSSVSVVGNRVAVTANYVSSQKAYIFHRTAAGTWILDAEMSDPESSVAPVDGFGSSLAFDGSNILVGDIHDNENSLWDSGAVYAAAPAMFIGDSCSDPIAFTGDSVTGCTTFATLDGSTSCGGNGANGFGPDVWYSWTPNCTGTCIFDTFGSNFDTVLSIHSACPGGVRGGIYSTNTIVCNDDAGGALGTASQVSLDYTAGTTYLIRVSGYNGKKGDFQIRLVQWQSPSNDSCGNPTTVTSGNTYTFSTCRATTDFGIVGTCMANAADDVWFRFVPPVTGVLNIDTCGSNYDTVLAIYNTGACPTAANGASEIACNDDVGINHAPCGDRTSAITTSLLAGFPYMIRVAGYATTQPVGDGVLHVNFTANCPCDWNLNGQVSVQDIFDFLNNYFSGNADFNHTGQTTVQDIFDFLACYFAGCP